MNSKQLKSLPVLSIADGTQIGTVARAYVDPTARQIVGFAVHTKSGLFEVESEPKIDAEKVHSLGTGGLMVDDAAATHGAAVETRLGELASTDDLTSLMLLTEEGVRLGQVASVEFDEHSFRLTKIDASPGLFKSNRSVAIVDVVTIGPEYVVVTGAVAAGDYDSETRPASAQSTSRRIRWIEAANEPAHPGEPAPGSRSRDSRGRFARPADAE